MCGLRISRKSVQLATLTLCIATGWIGAHGQEMRSGAAPKAVRSGRVFGNLAPVSRHIRLDLARQDFKPTGRGITVAVIGTGLQAEHRDFDGERIVARVNLTSDGRGTEDVADTVGSTTHMTGLIGADGLHQGVAPSCRLIPIRVFSNQGGGSLELVAGALEWVVEHANEHEISVVCLDAGDQGNYRSPDELPAVPDASRRRIRLAIESLHGRRVAVIVPVGNGYGAVERPGHSFPAVLAESISVGGVYSGDVGPQEYGNMSAFSTGVDRIAPFSQRLPRQDGLPYATVVFAPCGPLTSTGVGHSEAQAVHQGTSVSAGVTAGVVALMQEQHKRLTGSLPEIPKVVSWLRRGGVPIIDGDDEVDSVPHTEAAFERLDAYGTLALMTNELQPKQTSVAVATEGPTRGFAETARIIRLDAARRDFRLRSREGGGELRPLGGYGLRVAIIGTGIRVSHADFEGRIRAVQNFTRGMPRDAVSDSSGSGSIITGLIAANGPNLGVAPGAEIVVLKVAERSGEVDLRAVNDALEWIKAHHKEHGISVVALDVAVGLYASPDDAMSIGEPARRGISETLHALRKQRIAVVAPAGDAASNEAGDRIDGMSFPAVVPPTISVGGSRLVGCLDEKREIAPNALAQRECAVIIASESQRLPRDGEREFGTDVFAPAGPLVSTGIGHDESRASFRGTSASMALTTGAILLLQEYNVAMKKELPEVDQLEKWLRRGQALYDEVGDAHYSHLDIYSALRACREEGLNTLKWTGKPAAP